MKNGLFASESSKYNYVAQKLSALIRRCANFVDEYMAFVELKKLMVTQKPQWF